MLNYAISQQDLCDADRNLSAGTAEDTFFSCVRKSYNIDCILSYPPPKKTLSKFKCTEIKQNEYSYHNRITLEMNNKVNKKISKHLVTKQIY